MKPTKSLSFFNLILIIVMTVYSFSSMSSSFFMMGLKSFPWFLISAFFYFIPYALIVSEYTRSYSNRTGGIYDWLKDAFSPRIAFITAFLWYCSYFTWIISLFMKLLIPFTIMLFGQDLTSAEQWFGIDTAYWIMVLSLVAVFCMTWVINRGHQAVFSFLKTSSYAMVGLLLISGIGNLMLMVNTPQLIAQNMQQSLAAPSFFKGTNDSFLSQLPFFIFAITAFGGLDTIASLVDKSGQQQKKFPKALIISAVIIVVLYFGGIMLWSGANNLNVLRETDQFHLGNLMYGLMGSLANNLSIAFGLSASAQAFLYQAFIRYTAFTLFVAYIGLLSSITYTPLKSLIQGTPKEIWPQFLTKINQKQMPQTALWIQASVVSVCIIGLSLNSTILGALFNQLTYMTNVARAIPYFVVAASYPFYRIKNPGLLKHSLIASHWQGYLCSLSVCTATLIAITFQVYQPFHTGEYVQALLLIIGPILFGLLGSSIYQRFEKKRTQLFLEDNL